MLSPGTTVGRYIVRRKLAEGGMAEIYLASAQGPEGFAKDVVLKVVRSFLASDKSFVDMFIGEARLVSKLNHANIVQIFDFGKHNESYYLAMEYVRGASLWDLRRRCRELGVPFPPLLAAEIATQVARGLHYAHSLAERGVPLGLVHRDVTPHNVLLSFDGAVKLTDFGIAKASSSHTQPGMLKGKFAYMSPEQARAEAVDHRTDVFALGIVLWELLTGGRLFDADTEIGILKSVQDSIIAPPHRLNPDVPVELSSITLKALARAPVDRYQSAFELERALAMFVLKHAEAVEDTSVALFLQQMMREEYTSDGTPVGTPSVERATPSGIDELGLGDTAQVDRAMHGVVPQVTHTATPAPNFKPGLQVDSEATTDEHAEPPHRPRTEQMPGLRAGRPTEPMPGRPGLGAIPALDLGGPKTWPLGPQPLDGPHDAENPPAPGPPLDESPPVGPHTVPLPGVAERPVATPLYPSSTLSATDPSPDPLPRRSPVLAIVSAAIGVGLLAGVGYAWYASQSGPDSRAVLVTPPAVRVVPELKPVVPEVDAGIAAVAVDAGSAPVAQAPDAAIAAVEVARVVDAGVVKDVPRIAPGIIEIRAKPWATVTLNGRTFEVQGKERQSMKPGTYRFVLAHPKKKVDGSVTVKSGEVKVLTFDALQP